MTSELLVVVHYGDMHSTVAVANTLAHESEAPARLVVVANDLSSRPSDLSAAVTWLVPPRNLGYGGAANYAHEQLGGELLMVLNNDIEISCFQVRQLFDLLRSNPSLAVVAPTIINPGGEFQSGPGYLTRITESPRLFGDPGGELVECEWVTGAVLALSTSHLAPTLFDSSYFLGSEDLDLCVRARAAGHIVACAGWIRVPHELSASIGPAWAYYGPRNRLWFLAKRHGRRVRWALGVVDVLIRTIRFALSSLLRGRARRDVVWHFNGWVHGVKRPPGISDGPWQNEPVPYIRGAHGRD